MRRWGHVALVGALALALLVAVQGRGLASSDDGGDGAHAIPGCAPVTLDPTTRRPVGGEWRNYGNDLADTRSQPAETTIGAANVATLKAAWVADIGDGTGQTGGTNSTPIVADGCVFVGNAGGDVVALNADTGAQVWKTSIRSPATSGAAMGDGGFIVGATVVARQRVYALLNEAADAAGNGPRLVALDEATGAVLWKTEPLHDHLNDYTNATPAVFPVRGEDDEYVVAAGWSPAEGDPEGQGGLDLFDARSGRLLVQTYTVPTEAERAAGYAGGGVWSTPAYDAATGFMYVGAGNPFSKTKQHPNTNAILKIDLNADGHFGQIVGAYRGNTDQYSSTLEALQQNPVCQASDNPAVPPTVYTFDDPACGQFDLDFGASPNIFRIPTPTGPKTLVGALQKAGVYHAIDPVTMTKAWSTVVGGFCHPCNAATTAVGGGGIYGVDTPGGLAFGLDPSAGGSKWAAETPLAGGLHYESMSYANGVAYTFDTEGFLDALDAGTGTPLLRWPMAADTQQPMTALTSGGVAIARHTLYVGASGGAPGAQSGLIVAYRLPPS